MKTLKTLKGLNQSDLNLGIEVATLLIALYIMNQ